MNIPYPEEVQEVRRDDFVFWISGLLYSRVYCDDDESH